MQVVVGVNPFGTHSSARYNNAPTVKISPGYLRPPNWPIWINGIGAILGAQLSDAEPQKSLFLFTCLTFAHAELMSRSRFAQDSRWLCSFRGTELFFPCMRIDNSVSRLWRFKLKFFAQISGKFESIWNSTISKPTPISLFKMSLMYIPHVTIRQMLQTNVL